MDVSDDRLLSRSAILKLPVINPYSAPFGDILTVCGEFLDLSLSI